jgi:chromosome segregation ATPase
MLKDKFNALINELENVDNRIERLQDENKELQKLVDEGFNSFNTDTHCLIKRDDLSDMIGTLEDISTYTIEDEISSAKSYCEEAEYNLDSITEFRDSAIREIEKLLKDTKVVEEEKKTPAKKQQ